MKSEDKNIPLFTLAILGLSAFAPAIQVLLIELNSILFGIVEALFGDLKLRHFIWLNVLGTLVSLWGYFISVRVGIKVMWAIFSVFFFVSFTGYISEIWNYDRYPYFIPILIQAFLIAGTLYLIAWLKEKRASRKSDIS